jgi:chorismate synthase
MNSFGRLFKVSIFGESNGDVVGKVVDGCPAGLPITEEMFKEDLKRRRPGGKGATSRLEADIPIIKTGLFNGRTTGMPMLIVFENKNIDPTAYESIRYTPRPGHADFTAYKKYGGFNDYRGGGQFSGRMTVPIVAAGVIAKRLIDPVRVGARLIEAGGTADIEGAIEAASKAGDSIGGVVECRVDGIPPGLGEPFFDSVESLLSHACFSIPGIKAIEFGAGFACARMKGSEYNDGFINIEGTTSTNHSAGINGGITNGNEIYFRVAVRPTASISLPQMTVNLTTGDPAEITIKGRHDTCIAIRVPVIVEAVTAMVMADLILLEQGIKRVMV